MIIKELTIHDKRFKDQEIIFKDKLNFIIGGSASGKTTLFNYIKSKKDIISFDNSIPKLDTPDISYADQLIADIRSTDYKPLMLDCPFAWFDNRKRLLDLLYSLDRQIIVFSRPFDDIPADYSLVGDGFVKIERV